MAEPTEEQKQAELEDILKSGVSSVSVEGKTISYKDNVQLAQALEFFKRKKRTTPSVAVNPYFDKGL